MNPSCTMAMPEGMSRSQFFQSLRHFSSQEKLLSTTQRLGMTAKAWSPFRFAISTVTPSSIS